MGAACHTSKIKQLNHRKQILTISQFDLMGDQGTISLHPTPQLPSCVKRVKSIIIVMPKHELKEILSRTNNGPELKTGNKFSGAGSLDFEI